MLTLLRIPMGCYLFSRQAKSEPKGSFCVSHQILVGWIWNSCGLRNQRRAADFFYGSLSLLSLPSLLSSLVASHRGTKVVDPLTQLNANHIHETASEINQVLKVVKVIEIRISTS